jgi:peptidoglycan/LPS O-acetylase OafA/YrhL
VLPPYVLLTFLYRYLWLWEGTEYSAADIFQRILAGDPVDLFSWYVWFILVFCLFFALAMKLTGKDETKMIIAGVFFWLVWYVFCRLMHYGIWWYDTAHTAVLGMLWYRHEERILQWLRKYRLPAIIAGSILIVILSPLSLFSPFVWQLPLYILSTSVFVSVMNAVLLKHSPCNKALRFLGTVSYEMYLAHGLFVIGFRGTHIYLGNDALYTAAVLIFAVLSAVLLHRLASLLSVRRTA